MKVVGVIAEYNPFHNGHAYQIKKAKEITKADYCIVLMSGDFVQRGSPACFDKWLRTKMALAGGADAVLELPVHFATGSAEYFAKGSIRILDGLGIVDALCFGSENGDAALLSVIAKLLLKEPDFYQMKLKTYLKEGLNFPVARKKALQSCLSVENTKDFEPLLPLLDEPNNILGIEYLKALQDYKSKIIPYSIKRKGAGYHASDLSSSHFCSATAIRNHLKHAQTLNGLETYLPSSAISLLAQEQEKVTFIEENDLSALLRYSILQYSKSELADFFDVTTELANCIYKLRHEYFSFQEFAMHLKQKQYTMTRIWRALLHIILKIETRELHDLLKLEKPPYVRLLGFRKSATYFIKKIQENSSIPILTKIATAKRILSEKEFCFLKTDLFASHLMRDIQFQKFGYQKENEYRQKMILFP